MQRRVNYFFDTEFVETPGELVPISIGMVCEDGREIYLVSNSHDWHKYPNLDPWIKKNVIDKLPPRNTWDSPEVIARKLNEFIHDRPQFWAYFASYDWVCLCWLMGVRMIDVPTAWPHLVMDLKQSMIERGIVESRLPPKNKKKQHDALEDARWLKRAHEVVFGLM